MLKLHRKLSVLALLLIASILLAACGGVRGDSWAGIASNGEPSTLGDTVYVSYNEKVMALNASTGKRLWEYPGEDDRDSKFFAIPVVDKANETVYVGDFKGRLHAINTTDGKVRWLYTPPKGDKIGPLSTTPDDRIISGVALGDDMIFYGLASRNVVALPRSSTQPNDTIWTFETDHGVWGTPLYVPAQEDRPAMLYVVSLDQFFYALYAETGEEMWKIDMKSAAPGSLTYDARHNWAYVGTLGEGLLLIDLNAQKILSSFETEGWIWGSPIIEAPTGEIVPNTDQTAETSDAAATAEPTPEATAEPAGTEDTPQGDMLYFGDLNGYLYAVSVSDTGAFTTIWKKQLSEAPIRATPALTPGADGMVIVGSKDKRIYAFAKDNGTKQWEQTTEGEVLTDLVLVPSDPEDPASPLLVVAGTSENKELVVAYNIETGKRDWDYSE